MRRDPSKSIAEVIKAYIAEAHLEEGLFRVKVYDAWDKVIALRIAPYAANGDVKALTLSKSFADGVLRCTMASSVVRSSLRAEAA